MSSCERCGNPLRSSIDACAACVDEGSRVGDPFLGRVLEGRYRVVRRLGAGAYGTVHEVLDQESGRKYASKSQRRSGRQDERAIARFLNEARALLRLEHPAIASVVDVGELEFVGAFFVMELIEGQSLRALLSRGSLSPELALQISLDLVDALDCAHRLGVVHRDLKPENIVVLDAPAKAEPRAKLIDFGIARLDEVDTFASLSSLSHILGTPGYMAPEYVRHGASTPSSDQYSLGVVLYEMLTGRLPYEAPSAGSMLVRQATTEPVALSIRLPSVDPALEGLVMRALARDPRSRFASMSAMREELAPLVQPSGS